MKRLYKCWLIFLFNSNIIIAVVVAMENGKKSLNTVKIQVEINLSRIHIGKISFSKI